MRYEDLADAIGNTPLVGLPRLSPRVGDVVRTNSEVLVGVVSGERERSLRRWPRWRTTM